MVHPPEVAFLIHTHVLTADKFSRIFGFYRILDRHFVHQRDARIGLRHKDNQHPSIYRNIKSRNNFYNKTVLMALLT